MKSINMLLKEAEKKWREEIREDFPLRADTPVVKKSQSDGRDWTFSTDLRKIFANISNDGALQKKFESIITKYWEGNPDELARETLHYLLYHELYHPIEAPFSVSGEGNDNKRIHQAIRRGVVRAEPKLSPLEQVVKVCSSQNGVKDFILDNRFALDNQAREHVRQDIIPTWDLLELQKSDAETNFYTVTRLLYGLMYGPEKAHAFFGEKSGKDGPKVAERALSALINGPIQLPSHSLIEKAKSILRKASDKGEKERIQGYVKATRRVFEGTDRYAGIERFMGVLGPYVKGDTPQGRADVGEGAGVSPQNILQDLLDDMPQQEQEQFLQALSQEKPRNLEQAASQIGLTQGSVDEMNNLDLLATHEFYKRNHPKVKIVGGKKIGESLVVGKREHWNLKNSQVISEEELNKVNLRRIELLQRKTRLPWLVDLKNGTYRLNEYELKQTDVKDVVYVDSSVDIPDVLELYLDSSGSMGTQSFKVGDGSGWDMLSHVVYGLADALQQGGRHLGKQSKVRVHNFANRQVSSEIVPVDQFWNGDPKLLQVLFKPGNGYDEEDLNITRYNDGLKRTYVVATDGNLVIPGRTEREAAKMKTLAKAQNGHVLLFEIGGEYGLGRAVKNDPHVIYHTVHDKAKMLQAGLEVLLTK